MTPLADCSLSVDRRVTNTLPVLFEHILLEQRLFEGTVDPFVLVLLSFGFIFGFFWRGHCQRITCSLSVLDIGDGILAPRDSLSLPIRRFVAQFAHHQLLGVASQALGFLLCDSIQQLGVDIEKEIALRDFGASSKVYKAIESVRTGPVIPKSERMRNTRLC